MERHFLVHSRCARGSNRGKAWTSTPHLSIDDLLAGSAAPGVAPRAGAAAPLAAAVGMRTARVISVAGRRATLALRGAAAPIEAEIAPEVDQELIADARANGVAEGAERRVELQGRTAALERCAHARESMPEAAITA
jgi:hypothetical protein